MVVNSEEKEEDHPHPCENHLTEEHLQHIFEIQQKQDDYMHSQCILGKRPDILFDALVGAPAWTRCPMCSQQ
jgi:hypothetical protein